MWGAAEAFNFTSPAMEKDERTEEKRGLSYAVSHGARAPTWRNNHTASLRRRMAADDVLHERLRQLAALLEAAHVQNRDAASLRRAAAAGPIKALGELLPDASEWAGPGSRRLLVPAWEAETGQEQPVGSRRHGAARKQGGCWRPPTCAIVLPSTSSL